MKYSALQSLSDERIAAILLEHCPEGDPREPVLQAFRRARTQDNARRVLAAIHNSKFAGAGSVRTILRKRFGLARDARVSYTRQPSRVPATE